MIGRPLRVFIASASEGLDVAIAVRDNLGSCPGFEPRLWSEDTFQISQTVVESLEKELAQCDFGVMTLTADDQSLSRGHVSMAPRDNVLFELGLFMGHLGRERTYFVCDNRQDLKIPTDLLGVKPAIYECRDGQTAREALSVACSSIARRMEALGIRQKYSPEAEAENRLLNDFCQRIAGTWWGRQWPSEGVDSRLALFRIASDYGTSTVQLDGETFEKRGTLYGRWRSVAIGLRVRERTLLWAWEGTHPTLSPGETFGGFGQYTFDESSGIYERADGLFADIHKARKKAARWTSVELHRVDLADLERITRVMKNGSDNERAAEVIKTLDSFTLTSGHAI
jgi:Predicted nucleotide-binding protein containing TIR-like domain